MRRVTLTTLQRLPPQDIGRGPAQVAIDATGTPLLWCAERLDRGYYLDGVYRFLRFAGDSVAEVPIPPLAGSHPQLYPFVDGRLLAIFTRVSPRLTQDNAFVFAPDGERLASLRTADAVADVQITAGGDIWVSYFDETDGSGLDCFDARGQRVFTYQSFRKEHGLPHIDDCYALNVGSDTETWAYYYSDFPLVRLVNRALAGRWDASTIPGAHALAVDGRRGLFAGTYDRPDGLFLLDLQTGVVEELKPTYARGGGMSLAGKRCSGRSSRLYVTDSHALYTVDLTEIR